MIFPYAFIAEKEIFYIQGIPRNQGINFQIYFLRSNGITVMIHFNSKNTSEIDPNITPAEIHDVISNIMGNTHF